MTISPVTPPFFQAAKELLEQNNLPADDISANTHLFILTDNEKIIGTVGLEYEGEHGLLRSLCVANEGRSKGAGQQLVQFIENYAKEKNIQTLYLLTTTADQYFGKRGYTIMNRQDLPDAIKRTSEFTSVCPASAIVMKKELT